MYVISLQWTIAGKSSSKTETVTGTRTLGRAAENTFSIPDPSVSKRQAQIYAGSTGVKIKNLSETAKVVIESKEYGLNAEAALSNKLNFKIGNVTFYCLVITVPDGSELTAKCTTCSRPIVPGTTVCPWCGNTQQTKEGGFTMA